MEQSSATIIVQQLKDWEIQILLLLSFALQSFLFFFGGLRRRSSHALLRLFLWLTYLSADYIAVYALGYLSRHLPSTTDEHICYQACLEKNLLSSQSHHDLTLLWAPFLLVHLGGQDILTAFSIEDNELWSRHLLSMLVQVCLVLYVLWNSVAHNRLVVPMAFVFVSGVIKYGERIWALKGASQKSLKNSTSSEALKKESIPSDGRQQQDHGSPEDGNHGTELEYSSIVKRALRFMPVLREVLAGRKGYDMGKKMRNVSPDEQLAFKTAEVELSMIYDELYTKSKVIQTRNGTILRGVSLAFTVVAFVLFILNSSGLVDIAITYTLFTGAFCLEACAIVTAMVSPRAWASMDARGGGCSMLARATRSISVVIQPETTPRWANSMGQYNFVSSCLDDNKSRIAKMMDAAVQFPCSAGTDHQGMGAAARLRGRQVPPGGARQAAQHGRGTTHLRLAAYGAC